MCSYREAVSAPAALQLPDRRMKRPRSLFSRLFAAQVLVSIVLTATLSALFYADRNRTVAQLVASRWAPALRSVARGETIAAARERAPGPLYAAAAAPPAGALRLAAIAPRLQMMRDALAEEGVPVIDLAFSRETADATAAPTLWLALRAADGSTRWVGFENAVIEARLGERVVIAIVLLFGLALGASAFVARRLARPLEALRARIACDDSQAGPLLHASAEVQAIDAAWRGLRQTLAQQERERALLLAGVSHDLRSPLARIRMAAELLPDGAGVAPRREVIVRNAALADRLVGSFLDHVRSGELPLDETVDVAAIARSAAAQTHRAPGDMNVEAPAVLAVPRANAVLVERAMANLLDNAFTHGSAPVTLRVSTPPGLVRIEVEDAGAGIAPDQQAAMLQAFARADASRQRPGLGLGLAVVQRVAMRMGGRVSFGRSANGRRNVVCVEWARSE
jgi:two-component system, OmpR family, osmolarity sensor histidine kinase EnvZ